VGVSIPNMQPLVEIATWARQIGEQFDYNWADNLFTFLNNWTISTIKHQILKKSMTTKMREFGMKMETNFWKIDSPF